jgi:hypothetical protein
LHYFPGLILKMKVRRQSSFRRLRVRFCSAILNSVASRVFVGYL